MGISCSHTVYTSGQPPVVVDSCNHALGLYCNTDSNACEPICGDSIKGGN